MELDGLISIMMEKARTQNEVKECRPVKHYSQL